MPLRILQLNLAFDPSLATPDALLATYHTLTGWSRAMTRAGAHVHVVQRFAADAQRTRDAVTYAFVTDGRRGVPRPWDRSDRLVEAVVRARPDLVHVNGLMFPATTCELRAALGPHVPIVLQDHSGALPRRLPWPASRAGRERWRRAFRMATACTFTARQLAERWHAAGLPDDLPILEMPEASTEMAPIDRREAASRHGIAGSPVILWVGRLEANKDPMTVLDALDRALPDMAEARVAMIGAGPFESSIRARVARTPLLTARVSMVGPVPHDRVHEYYSAADLFVSGSHHEGSGYALIEALACGVTPCVTDIPAFRALAGPVGRCWRAGDAKAAAAALLATARASDPTARERVLAHFHEHLHWDRIAARTLGAYRALVEAAA